MPKFKIEGEFSLSDPLVKMGMPLAFDPEKADFSGMDGDRDLYISDVIHKAYCLVDEKGTEAAAATAVIVGTSSAPVGDMEFVADHPFIFLIRDNETGTILFVGRVTNPSPVA
jgi:serpin B